MSSEGSDGFWLPETEDRPLRPDLPWARNLSWTKVHAAQLGFGIALIVYWAFAEGESGLALALVVNAGQFVFGEVQERGEGLCDHDIGAHDLVEKPWYGLSAALGTLLVLVALWGMP